MICGSSLVQTAFICAGLGTRGAARLCTARSCTGPGSCGRRTHGAALLPGAISLQPDVSLGSSLSLSTQAVALICSSNTVKHVGDTVKHEGAAQRQLFKWPRIKWSSFISFCRWMLSCSLF
jgi:hypothetical protein